MPTDPVDELLAQWRRERPDIDFAPMGLIGRVGRLSALIGRSIDAELGDHALTVGEFDVLAALRRSGAPFELKPTDLSRALMLSPAGMTNRLDRLEAAGHVERRMDPDDRRSYLVRLSKQGRSTIDRAVVAHVDNETRLLAPLTEREQRTLDSLLRKMLGQFET